MKNLVRKFVGMFKKPEPHHHFFLEIGMTDECNYGCKIVKCERCGDTIVSHRRIYGCPQG